MANKKAKGPKGPNKPAKRPGQAQVGWRGAAIWTAAILAACTRISLAASRDAAPASSPAAPLPQAVW